MKTDHILIIRFSAMGDVAMTVPVVYSLAMQYPHLRITVLSKPFARAFYEDLAPNVGFMEASTDEMGNIKGLNELYRRLTAKKFTAIADFHDVLRSKYLRLRFNVDQFRVEHIDKHRKGKRMLVSQQAKQLVQQPTSFQNYADVLARHAAALAEANLDSSGHLVDFYTFADGSKAHRLTMCYADWTALDILVQQQPTCAAAVQAAQQLVDEAYLGDAFPFYANYYDYQTGTYDNGSLNMAEALLTLLHQAEAGRLPDAALRWLHIQMAGNGIWARYDIHGNVVPGYEYQSPAVYAIVGLIAAQCQDDVLLTQAVSRMESFRCFEAQSPLNGAFSPSMDEVSSFDQCMALVLYATMEH